VVALVALTLVLAGCSAPVPQAGTTVTVALPDSLTSLNPKTSYGNSATNGAINAATSSQFAAYDSTPKLVRDPSFGNWQVISQSPFVVKYTIASGIEWSDGVPVDASDLMLSWLANSGSRNTAGVDTSKYTDDDGRLVKPLPKGVVHFDGFSGNGLQLVKKTPTVGDGGHSLTLTYDRYFPDWQLVFGAGLPAHIVAGRALGITDPGKAKAALLAAVTSDDPIKLSKVATFWNTGYDLTSTPKDRGLLVSDGPYSVTSVTADRVVLQANRHYIGAHSPKFERVVVKSISDPLAAVKALADGSVDVISPAPSRDVNAAMRAVSGSKITSAIDGSWEHLDLQFAHGRNATFASVKVRQAFLDVVPRQQILDQLVTPLERGAMLRNSQLFLPGTAGYDAATKANGSSRYSAVDVAAARALLASAGVTAPQVCILFDPSNPRRVLEFAAIQKSAARAGFVVTDCSSPDWRELLGTPGAYDASLYAFKPSTLAVSSVGATYRSNSGIDNHNFYSNPGVDALIDRLDVATSESSRDALMRTIDTRLWTDAYGVTLYQFPAISATNGRVRGVSRSPLPPGLLWNVWAWTPVAP
jgi:peptide/nickel transport system substrate-binding protein